MSETKKPATYHLLCRGCDRCFTSRFAGTAFCEECAWKYLLVFFQRRRAEGGGEVPAVCQASGRYRLMQEEADRYRQEETDRYLAARALIRRRRGNVTAVVALSACALAVMLVGFLLSVWRGF